jgi:hypothetical protein
MTEVNMTRRAALGARSPLPIGPGQSPVCAGQGGNEGPSFPGSH